MPPGSGERENWRDIVLRGAVETALRNLNHDVPEQYSQQAYAEVTTPQSQDAIIENFRLHKILTEGYRGISYIDHDGRAVNPTIRAMSADPAKNRNLAVNQVTIRSHEHERRFDIVLYINGLPLSIIELKQASAKSASAAAAYNQLQTYLREFPMAFRLTCFILVTDGINAQYGTPFTPWNHFAPWNVDDDGHPVEYGEPAADGEPATELDLTLAGVYNVERFGQLLVFPEELSDSD